MLFLKRKRRPVSTRFSLVVACYNVEKYLDDFFRSVFSQNIDLECIEIIAVDDGSTDATAARIATWQRRYPHCIRYFHQSNQKQATARNTGLAHATSEWISFPDPDDMLAPDYFRYVGDEIARARNHELSMVCCNLVYFKEASWIGTKEKAHWLSYRFRNDLTVLAASDLEDHIAIGTNTAWFRRDLIERHKLRYDPRVVPTFEDGHFANRFLLLNPGTKVAFVKGAIYCYRKRADGTSTLDKAKQSPAWCLDALRHGYLDLLNQARRIAGFVPKFIQRTVLYDVLFRFHRLVDHPERVPLTSPAQWKEFFALLKRIFAAIDQTTIETFDLGPWTEMHRVGLLGLMKNARPATTKIHLRQYDEHKGLMRFSYFSASPEIEVVARVNGENVPLRYVSRQRSTFLDRDYVFEHFFWVALGAQDHLSTTLNGEPCDLMCEANPLGVAATFRVLRRALDSQYIAAHSLRIALLRRFASTRKAKAKYDACWLFSDRPSKADDNAEHLYRYLLKQGLTAKMFFVLKRDSPDWQRLKSDGFQLIPLGSLHHRIALINAKFVVSSQLDEVKQWPGGWRDADMCRYRLAFIEHGVIKDDISRWLNTKPIALMLTSTQAEHDSIVDPQSNYRMSEKEITLTGLPRHDRLWSMPKTRRTVLVMPTWRKFLLDKKRKPIPGFAESDYVRHWRSVLQSAELRNLIEECGLKLAFCPHAAIAPFIEHFAPPDYVEVIDQLAAPSLHPVFAGTALLLTDYSSVAFELAYIESPVIYYQFDAKAFYEGGHLGFAGYFDFARDGFGPVCESEDALLSAVQAALSGTEDSAFAERRRTTFLYRDGQCCRRTYERILELDAPMRNSLSGTDIRLHARTETVHRQRIVRCTRR